MKITEIETEGTFWGIGKIIFLFPTLLILLFVGFRQYRDHQQEVRETALEQNLKEEQTLLDMKLQQTRILKSLSKYDLAQKILAENKQGQLKFMPDLRWVEVVNPEPIANETTTLFFCDECIFTPGYVAYRGSAGDVDLYEYLGESAGGETCPNHTLFFLPTKPNHSDPIILSDLLRSYALTAKLKK